MKINLLIVKKNIHRTFESYFQHYNYHYNYYFRYQDRGDGLIIRFFCNYGFFNERVYPSCIYCGKNNSRKHILNDCNEKYFIDLRDKYINKINELKGNNYTKNQKFENILLKLYFEPDKDISKVLPLIKEFMVDLYILRPKAEEDYIVD